MTSDSPRSDSKSPRLALHWQVLIGLALGVGYAWASIQFGWNSFTLNYIQPFRVVGCGFRNATITTFWGIL